MADLASIAPMGNNTDTQQEQGTAPSLDSIIPETPTLSAGTDTMMSQMNTQGQDQAPTTTAEPSEAQNNTAPAFTATDTTTTTAAPTQEPLRHEYIEPQMGPSKAAVFFIALCACATGILLGTVLFAGKQQPATIVNGLTGVVKNPDLANQQLRRCGEVDKGRACILYLMNHTRYDRMADTFFDEAVRLTEVAKYSIAMVNPQYAKTLIRPGQIAEIKIPAQN